MDVSCTKSMPLMPAPLESRVNAALPSRDPSERPATTDVGELLPGSYFHMYFYQLLLRCINACFVLQQRLDLLKCSAT